MNRPMPDLPKVNEWRPLPTGSIKAELRRLRQMRNLSQTQLSELMMERPPDLGGRYKQAEIQRFETPGPSGRPIHDEVRIAFEDTLAVPRGTLLAMAGYIDDVSLWVPSPGATVETDGEDTMVKAADRLFHGDPYLTPAQADMLVETYRNVRAAQKSNMPSGEIKRRPGARRRLE